MKKLWIIILFFFSYECNAQFSKGRKYLDSLISLDEKLNIYNGLNYCSKLTYLDGIVNSDKEGLVFYESYFRLAVFDICMYAKIDPKTNKSEFAPIYRNKEDYYKVSQECSKKLKCKKPKIK